LLASIAERCNFNAVKFQLIIALTSVIMLTSCINDTPYDGKIGAPKVVLNTILQPDSLLTATVSRTAHFLDIEEPQRLADATVIAIVNGKEELLTYTADTEDYRSAYCLRPGDEVTLTATHAIGTATATAQVMKPHAITIAQTTMQPFINPDDPVSLATLNDVDSALLVSLHIDDPADEKNYYRLTIDYEGTYQACYPSDWIYAEGPTEDTLMEGDMAIIEEVFYPHYLLTESSSRLVIESESAAQLLGGLLYMTSSNSIIFSDEHLRGADGQPVIDFLMLMEYPRSSKNMYNSESGWGEEDLWEGEPNDFIFPADTVSSAHYRSHFILETLSEDYYRYLNDVASYSMMGGLSIGEPTPIHTNIRGGLGIVGSYASKKWEMEMQYKLGD
jgi:hypothetical protein